MNARLACLVLALAATQACAARREAPADTGGVVPLTLEQQWEIEADARRQSG